MPELWLPGAEKRPENNGGTMIGGPPRAVWHITWDQLGAGGKMPSFDAISNYLQSVNYCPHLMWDPWSGRIVQYYPANASGRALGNKSGGVETNREGRACIQVETWFSPGAVVGGKRYNTVADTPCTNIDKIVQWMRSWGIPDAWPLGWPKWSGNSRNSTTWSKYAGHYGHCHVPENDHTDPGPMPRDMFERDDVALSDDDIERIAQRAAVLAWKQDGIIPAPASEQEKGNMFWGGASYARWGYEQGKDSNERLRALEEQIAEVKALLQGKSGGTS